MGVEADGSEDPERERYRKSDPSLDAEDEVSAGQSERRSALESGDEAPMPWLSPPYESSAIPPALGL